MCGTLFRQIVLTFHLLLHLNGRFSRQTGLQWWRSGNITRTQNVSEYMLVLALCLVSPVVLERVLIGDGVVDVKRAVVFIMLLGLCFSGLLSVSK